MTYLEAIAAAIRDTVRAREPHWVSRKYYLTPVASVDYRKSPELKATEVFFGR